MVVLTRNPPSDSAYSMLVLIYSDDFQMVVEAVQALDMRAGIVANVTRADRRRLEAIVLDRSAPQKHVWRANIIIATADGCGTAEIMRRSGKFEAGGMEMAGAVHGRGGLMG